MSILVLVVALALLLPGQARAAEPDAASDERLRNYFAAVMAGKITAGICKIRIDGFAEAAWHYMQLEHLMIERDLLEGRSMDMFHHSTSKFVREEFGDCGATARKTAERWPVLARDLAQVLDLAPYTGAASDRQLSGELVRNAIGLVLAMKRCQHLKGDAEKRARRHLNVALGLSEKAYGKGYARQQALKMTLSPGYTPKIDCEDRRALADTTVSGARSASMLIDQLVDTLNLRKERDSSQLSEDPPPQDLFAAPDR